MKKITFVIFYCFLWSIGFSQEVDEKTAQIVAKNFFLQNYGFKKTVESTVTKKYKDHESLFFCNMNNGGWVAVPANKNLNPVVAHSDEGKIVLYEGPEVFWDWMEQYEFIVDVAIEEKWNKEDRHKKWDELLADDFEEQNLLKSYVNNTYLVQSQWGQANSNNGTSCAYNYLMPTNSNCECGKPMAGCVAVAIGQIMNYWGYATGDYSNFDWWNMPDALYSYSADYEVERNSISYLLKRIGDMLETDYGCSSSSADTQDADYVFENFGYKDDMDYKRKSLHTYNAWVDILRTEIQAERPVLYRYKNHHSFVCDGYNSGNDNFHFNMGWRDNISSPSAWCDFEDLEDYEDLYKHECWVNIRPDVSNIESFTNTTIQSSNILSLATNKTYQVKSYISVAGGGTTFNILDSSSCRFVAGDSIVLKPGFHAQQGTSLLCKIYKKPTLKEGMLLDDKDIISMDDAQIKTENIIVYPNPVTDVLTIQYENDDKFETTIVIYNVVGAEIEKIKTTENSVKINTAQYPIGYYVINILLKNKLYVQSFIKN